MVTVNNLLTDAESRMKKAVEALRRELGTIRTGRANPALLEGLLVDYYGVSTPVNQLASVTTPEARVLIIQPWDKGSVPAIEKAILKSDLGLNPVNDGNLLRLQLPPLTQERRRDLVRLVHKRLEDGRVAVRNIRRDGIDKLRTRERDKQLSQDESRRAQDRLQKLTDTYIAQMEQVGQEKEAEVMEI